MSTRTKLEDSNHRFLSGEFTTHPGVRVAELTYLMTPGCIVNSDCTSTLSLFWVRAVRFDLNLLHTAVRRLIRSILTTAIDTRTLDMVGCGGKKLMHGFQSAG